MTIEITTRHLAPGVVAVDCSRHGRLRLCSPTWAPLEAIGHAAAHHPRPAVST